MVKTRVLLSRSGLDAKILGFFVCQTNKLPTDIEFLPNLDSFSSLPGDTLAAFSVASISIPQSISYATFLSGLSPLAGLVSNHLSK